MTVLEEYFSKSLFNPGALPGALFYGLVFLVLATIVIRLVRLAVAETLKRDHKQLIDPTVVTFLMQLAQFGIYLLAFILYAHLIPALRSLGTALLTGVSVISVIIGLAAQNTLGNLIAGISLLLYRPFHVGDRVQINAPTGLETGTVDSITLGYTVLKTTDNRRIVVPNSVMISQVTVNLTTQDPRAIAVIPVSIGYGSDVDKARAILMDLVQSHPLVQEIVSCPVTRLGDFNIVLSLSVRCANAGDAKQVEFDIYEQAQKRFDQEGIEIPFPYTNVVLKKEA
jgi:small conductance mechanosensitive channel